MNNFYYYNPTKIIFGKGSISKMAKEIPPDARILLLHGALSIKRNGVYEQIVETLKGRELHLFSGIEPNPDYETCLKAIEKIKEKGITYLLAAGGGSVIDAAKFVSLAVYAKGEAFDLLTGKSSYPDRALPIGCILTLPGTGSEMNNGFVISRRAKKAKIAGGSFLAYPRFSVLDPQVTLTLTREQTACGIVDMFTHVLEQYVTYPAGAVLQDRQAEALLLAIREAGPDVLRRPDDYDLRANLMWCAVHCLNGALSRGVPVDWSTHGIGHIITALYGLKHAQTLAVVLPGVWRNRWRTKKEKLAQYGERVWGVSGSPDEKAEKAIQCTENFFNGLGMSTRLSSYGLNAQQVAADVSAQMKISDIKLGEHNDIDAMEVSSILLSRS